MGLRLNLAVCSIDREGDMIAMAKEQGTFVEVYDENNRHLFSRRGKLHGYTSHAVTVKNGYGYLETWDDKGHLRSSRHV